MQVVRIREPYARVFACLLLLAGFRSLLLGLQVPHALKSCSKRLCEISYTFFQLVMQRRLPAAKPRFLCFRSVQLPQRRCRVAEVTNAFLRRDIYESRKAGLVRASRAGPGPEPSRSLDEVRHER